MYNLAAKHAKGAKKKLNQKRIILACFASFLALFSGKRGLELLAIYKYKRRMNHMKKFYARTIQNQISRNA